MSAEKPGAYPPSYQPGPQDPNQPGFYPMGQAPYQSGMQPQYQSYQAQPGAQPYQNYQNQAQPYPGSQPYPYPNQPYPGSQPYPGQPVYASAPNVQPVAAAVIIESRVPTFIYGFDPIQVTCPYCHQTALTKTERSPGMMVWLMCFILFCLFPFCSCLPFCIPSLFDVTHHCGHCSKRLGERRAL
ncbi:unnamed protein product [Blepharisma stoltei]|uniref:LITAF domain-containing protein n=1 Tax=Blepharisma stoltei TaxID=1481888 RepID=A0AAU9J562_9CILI|nr:unnamed protein product [Blepharisma stoltei]